MRYMWYSMATPWISLQKNSEQEQRQKSGKVSADVMVSADGSTCVSAKKAEFLLNRSNKSLLIKLLCQRLTEHGIGNSQCDGDADVLIVETAISIANTGKSVVVASDDTDVFIMLLKHVKTTMADVFYTTLMRDCKSSNTKPVPMWWHVQSIVTMLPIPSDLILFVHAWGGCDTTSATYGKGKMKLMEMLKSKNMQETVSCFGNVEATQEEIGSAGNSVMLCIFNGKSETLTALRYAEWRMMVLGKKKLKPESLPPTDRAVYFHALRVHLQVCQWATLNLSCLNPTQWGWKAENSVLVPVKTDIAAAPEFVLNVIRCSCKTTSKNTCGTKLCSCRKNGLACVAACNDCRGTSCNNVSGDKSDVILDDDILEHI